MVTLSFWMSLQPLKSKTLRSDVRHPHRVMPIGAVRSTQLKINRWVANFFIITTDQSMSTGKIQVNEITVNLSNITFSKKWTTIDKRNQNDATTKEMLDISTWDAKYPSRFSSTFALRQGARETIAKGKKINSRDFDMCIECRYNSNSNPRIINQIFFAIAAEEMREHYKQHILEEGVLCRMKSTFSGLITMMATKVNRLCSCFRRL